MAANKKAIKERIRSIRSTKKITSAMEVIANAKLAKQRSVMEKNRAYSDIIQDTIASIMASDIEIDSAFLNAKSSSNTYYLIFGSDLGLCGAYNMNAIKELLGHSSLAATQVYTHNSIGRLKKIYESAHPRARKNGGKNGD